MGGESKTGGTELDPTGIAQSVEDWLRDGLGESATENLAESIKTWLKETSGKPLKETERNAVFTAFMRLGAALIPNLPSGLDRRVQDALRDINSHPAAQVSNLQLSKDRRK